MGKRRMDMAERKQRAVKTMSRELARKPQMRRRIMRRRVVCVLSAVLLAGGLCPDLGAGARVRVEESTSAEKNARGEEHANAEEGERTGEGKRAREDESGRAGKDESGGAGENGDDRAACTPATVSEARREVPAALWDGWNGDADFSGDGTRERPYQIRTLSHLMGLSQAVSAGETFAGEYFALGADIDLNDLDVRGGRWNPIGWYASRDEMSREPAHPFSGHFDGRGHTIRNLNILPSGEQLNCLGLFGLIENGTVQDLTVRAGNVIGADNVAVLAGIVRGNSVIRNVTVSGFVSAQNGQTGCAGGIAAAADGKDGRVTIENCTADQLAVVSDQEDGCVGGIAGDVRAADLVDSVVQTGRDNSDHIQGLGSVGGVAGRMERANLYNSYVSGTIGGHRSRAVGGIAGEYISGNLVLARFGGEISSTGMGVATREGTFVGTRSMAHPFRYGTEPGDNLAYLFASAAVKARQAIGSGIREDNTFPVSAHIGYWTDDQRSYHLLTGNGEKGYPDRYFYEELEDGVRCIVTGKLQNEFTAQGAAEGQVFRLDHFAPGMQGQPVRGYLLSVPRIDTRNAGGDYDTDVAVLTAMPEGNLSYYRAIDKNHAAAVSPGTTVSVATSPKNRDGSRYQMVVDESEQGGVKPPVYIDKLGRQAPMTYVAGGTYSFTMPERDTQINVEYVKVTTELVTSPSETVISVTQTRTGDRRSPSVVTEVRAEGGALIARYIDGALDRAVQVQPVRIHGEHNTDGSAADRKVRWTVDDPDLLRLEAPAEYTEQDARIMPNIEGAFIRETLDGLLRTQADGGYREAIRPEIYERHAVVTAASDPATSVDGIPVYGNCKVTVRFQVLDRTTRRVEGLNLNRSDIALTVTRKLTGSRTRPVETISCSEPVVLSAELYPEQPFYKNVSWSDRESGASILLTPEGVNGTQCRVTVRYDPEGKANPAWIQNVINADVQKKKEDPYGRSSGSAEHTEIVTATSEDQTHGVVTAECRVTIRFETVDQSGSWGLGGGNGHGGGSYSGSGSGGHSSSWGAGAGGGSGSGSPGTGGDGTTGPGGGSSAGPGPSSAPENGLVSTGPGYTGAASGAVRGTWTQHEDGKWSFSSDEKRFYGCWAYVFNPYSDTAKGQTAANWFYFDADGYMVTGWRWIAGPDGLERCYYFNEEPDGTKGAMFASALTPDGYQVDASGAWTVDGTVQVR